MTETTQGESATSAPSAGQQQGAVAPRSPSPRRRHGRIAAAVLLVAAGGFAVWYFAIREPAPRNDFERFQGDWRISVGDRETPNAIQVSGERWVYIAGVGGEKAYRFQLNEAASPKEIDLELIDATGLRGAPVRMHGIYSFDGNRKARVIVAGGTEPRPKSFDGADLPALVLTKGKLEPNSEPRK